MSSICALIGISSAIWALVGFVTGYNYGVKDTERRWSDAVGRFNDKSPR